MTTMLKHFGVTVGFLIAVSCSVVNLAGQYQNHSPISTQKLVLNDDHTYHYTLISNHVYEISHGKWNSIKHRTIYIEPDLINFRSLPLDVRETVEKNVDSVYFYLERTRFKQANIEWRICINGIELPLNDCFSVNKDKVVDSFSIIGRTHMVAHYGIAPPVRKSIYSVVYHPKSSDCNGFYISFPEWIDDNVFSYVTISGRIKIKSNNSFRWLSLEKGSKIAEVLYREGDLIRKERNYGNDYIPVGFTETGYKDTVTVTSFSTHFVPSYEQLLFVKAGLDRKSIDKVYYELEKAYSLNNSDTIHVKGTFKVLMKKDFPVYIWNDLLDKFTNGEKEDVVILVLEKIMDVSDKQVPYKTEELTISRQHPPHP